MPVLKNPRHERFALLLAEGLSAYAAYEQAGYKPHDGNCIRLRGNERVQARLAELQQAAQKKTEVTIESLMAELEEARVKAVSLDQMSAAVKSISEKAKISGLLVQRVEVGQPGSFDDIDNLPDLIASVREHLGDDGAELVCAAFGLDENGAEVVKSASSLPFRRKLARYRARRADESIIREAIGPHIEAEITPADVAELRGLMHRFDELVDGIKARNARVINAIDPSEIEHRKLIADRNRTFNGGNGRQW